MILEKVVDKKDAAGRDHSKWSVNGEGEYNKQEIVPNTIVFLLTHLLKKSSLNEAIDKINANAQCTNIPLVVADKPESARYKTLLVSDGTRNYNIYAIGWLELEEMEVFQVKVNAVFDGVDKEKATGLFGKVKGFFGLGGNAEDALSKEVDLDALIDAVVADGVVTDDERALLLKKVKEIGADAADFEAKLNAKLQEAVKQIALKKSSKTKK